MERGTLRAHHIAHDHIQDRRHCTECDGPPHIVSRRPRSDLVRAQHRQQRGFSDGARQREQRAAHRRTVKSESGSPVHGVVIPAPQRPAHHAGTSHTEKVVDRIKCQQHRTCKRHRRILHRIVQDPHKIGVRQIVEHHHERTDDRRDAQERHRLWYRHALKDGCSIIRFCFAHIHVLSAHSGIALMCPAGHAPTFP